MAKQPKRLPSCFNRFNGGDWVEDSAAGEASGGGAVLESTGFDDFGNPAAGEFRLVVKTYLKPGPRGRTIQRQIEEGLWRLRLLYPMPEPMARPVREEDWAHAWKRHYKPLRIGKARAVGAGMGRARCFAG